MQALAHDNVLLLVLDGLERGGQLADLALDRGRVACGRVEGAGRQLGEGEGEEGQEGGGRTVVLDVHDAVHVEAASEGEAGSGLGPASRERPGLEREERSETHLTVLPLTVLISFEKQ